MADEVLVTSGEGNVDVQVGGPGNPWKYLSACASLNGPTVPHGSTELRWCQDPEVAGGFKVSTKIRTAPDQATGELTTKLGKIDYLEDLDCPFSLRARFCNCKSRWETTNYDPLMLTYCPVDLQEHSYGTDLVVTDPANKDEIPVTAPWASSYEYRIKKIRPARTGTAATLGDQAINDIEYCDTKTCGGVCGSKSDGCSKIYGVTDADAAPYAAPNLVTGTKSEGAITWAVAPILGVNGNVENIECAGSRLVISSNADSVVGYNDHDGDQDEWNYVAVGHAPSAYHNGLYKRTARELWLAAEDGYIYKSTDGGTSWTAMLEGDLTAENLNAIYAYDADLAYAVGDHGVILRTTDGGETWQDFTEVATTAANLLEVVVPPSRPKEVYVGTNDGQIFRSTDEGVTFANLAFDGDGVGTVDDIDFCGPCAGDVMYILHNDAGPRARILRDLSGGAGGNDVEIVMDYLDVIPVGIDLNAMDCCSVNEMIAAGELYGGYPVVIKAS